MTRSFLGFFHSISQSMRTHTLLSDPRLFYLEFGMWSLMFLNFVAPSVAEPRKLNVLPNYTLTEYEFNAPFSDASGSTPHAKGCYSCALPT
jgi:hypothetical protein